eukprot:gene21041-27911_t
MARAAVGEGSIAAVVLTKSIAAVVVTKSIAAVVLTKSIAAVVLTKSIAAVVVTKSIAAVVLTKSIAAVVVTKSIAAVVVTKSFAAVVVTKSIAAVVVTKSIAAVSSTLPPGVFLPQSYTARLSLMPELFSATPSNSTATFAALSTVLLSTTQDTSCVVLNADSLAVSSVNMTTDAMPGGVCLCGPDAGCKAPSCDAVFNTTAVNSSGTVIVDLYPFYIPSGGNATLSFKFRAPLWSKQENHGFPQGLWRSDPFDLYDAEITPGCPLTGPCVPACAPGCPPNSTEVILSTANMGYGVRRLMPCFDEPDVKAPFSLSVEAPPGMTVLSNMAQTSRTPSESTPGLDVVSFATSPPMSTYQLAVAVGRLVSLSSLSSSGKVNVSVWVVPTQFPGFGSSLSPSVLDLPIDLAKGAYDFFENWTGIPQPLSKVDMVAIPGLPFALEGWGLAMMDPGRFLFNPYSQGDEGRWESSVLICHSMAQQWWGGLVTAAGWDDYMATAGPAAFMQYSCVGSASPGIPASVLGARYPLPSGLWDAGSHTTYKMLEELADDDPSIMPLYPFSPRQGMRGWLLATVKSGMLFAYMNATMPDLTPGWDMKAIMHAYLVQHSYGTTTMVELLSNLSSGSNWSSWVYQPGHPILLAEATSTTRPPPTPPPVYPAPPYPAPPFPPATYPPPPPIDSAPVSDFPSPPGAPPLPPPPPPEAISPPTTDLASPPLTPPPSDSPPVAAPTPTSPPDSSVTPPAAVSTPSPPPAAPTPTPVVDTAPTSPSDSSTSPPAAIAAPTSPVATAAPPVAETAPPSPSDAAAAPPAASLASRRQLRQLIQSSSAQGGSGPHLANAGSQLFGHKEQSLPQDSWPALEMESAQASGYHRTGGLLDVPRLFEQRVLQQVDGVDQVLARQTRGLKQASRVEQMRVSQQRFCGFGLPTYGGQLSCPGGSTNSSVNQSLWWIPLRVGSLPSGEGQSDVKSRKPNLVPAVCWSARDVPRAVQPDAHPGAAECSTVNEPDSEDDFNAKEGALLDASSLLSDTLILQLSPFATASADNSTKPLLLTAIEAALGSPDSLSGMGAWLLSIPAIQALQTLQLRAPPASNCGTDLSLYTARLLRPLVKAMSKQYNASSDVYSDNSTEGTNSTSASLVASVHDAVLFNMVKSLVLTAAAAVDSPAAMFACTLFKDMVSAQDLLLSSLVSGTPPLPPAWDNNWNLVALSAALGLSPACINTTNTTTNTTGSSTPPSSGVWFADLVASQPGKPGASLDLISAELLIQAAAASTRNATLQLDTYRVALASASLNTSNPFFFKPISRNMACEVIALLARGAQAAASLPSQPSSAAPPIQGNVIFDAMTDPSATLWGETTVALGIQETAMGSDAVSRIKGRALSNVQWVNQSMAAICASVRQA